MIKSSLTAIPLVFPTPRQTSMPTTQPPPKVRACLFDMDGLLIDSERIYTEVTNEFLAQYGKGPMTPEVKVSLMGLPSVKASQVLLEWAELDLTPHQVYHYTSKMQEKLWPHVKPLPGAEGLIQTLISHNIPIALATSSLGEKYHMKTAHLQDEIFAHFPKDRVIVGDDPRIVRGKPDPDIFLLALLTINESLPEGTEPIHPSECLVFEDARLGVQAGRNAGMQVVWVPDPFIKNALLGQEQEILGPWGTRVETLAHVNLAEYGIGVCEVNFQE